jgi:hypothetical protein
LDGNAIGSITTAGIIIEYNLPAAASYPNGITPGPDGTLWFTEEGGNRIGEAVFVTAVLSVTPASGDDHTELTFSGSGFAPNEGVQIYVSGVGSAVLASAVADSSGSVTATARAPQSPYGPRIFLGVGQSSGLVGAAAFSVKARLILSPSSGSAGSTASVEGNGFGSLETVDIYWNNPRTLLGAATADVQGTFSGSAALSFTVPAQAPAGVHTVSGIGVGRGVHGYGHFTVQ